MARKAAQAVADERPFWGVHILATALMCSAGASADELELAQRILKRDPTVDAPRECESVAGAFNRHMDAALDSANDTLGNPSRASRRAQLAQDLDRAGLVLIDRSQVAELIAVVGELRSERELLLKQLDIHERECGCEDLGAELGRDEPLALGFMAGGSVEFREADGGADPLRGLELND